MDLRGQTAFSTYQFLTWIFFVLQILATCYVHILCQTIDCLNSESCINSTLVADDDINCYGYRSCGMTSITLTNGANIYCSASYSCNDAINITTTSTSDDSYIYCDGLFSCAHTQLILVQEGTVFCRGEQSCVNTNIVSKDMQHFSGV